MPFTEEEALGVGTAKYVPPLSHLSQTKMRSPAATQRYDQASSQASPYSPRRNSSAESKDGRWGGDASQSFKTEQWREIGADRWPKPAHQQLRDQPSQFSRSEEIVPLRRRFSNMQSDNHSHIWCRALRMQTLHRKGVGEPTHNGEMTKAAILLERDGRGWIERTNTKKGPAAAAAAAVIHGGPDRSEWAVSTGRLGLGHLGGSRYIMDGSPRPCCPGSMTHSQHAHASGARTAR